MELRCHLRQSVDEVVHRVLITGPAWYSGIVALDPFFDGPNKLRVGSKSRRNQFTVTVGTVMERSKISLQNWLMAFHLICSSKKGFSALQLQRELGLGSYKTAWFLLHRIRFAMTEGQLQQPMTGVVEADEAYIGGKPRPWHTEGHMRGRGTRKAPVAVLVQRDGVARSKPVARVDGATLKGNIRECVDQSATIVTDEWGGYVGIGKEFQGGHHVVRHGKRQYARKHRRSGLSINTNSAESFFALIKRGYYGVYHQMSRQHLHRYCAEFDFRWNHRKSSDHQRMEAAIRGVEGKRLMYETPAETA